MIHTTRTLTTKQYVWRKHGKTPGGIGFALNFLLLAFLFFKKKKSKSLEASKASNIKSSQQDIVLCVGKSGPSL